jgi:DNA-binding transcriptional regulator GbsR (MarR family)
VDRVIETLVDGLGAAAATSGIVTQLQARIFALLYLEARPLSLDEIAAELQQSKSNVSLNIRLLVDWHLVRRKPVAGSRRDHYEAATDFFRAFQEIFERRFRWTVRQVVGAVDDAAAVAEENGPRDRAARARHVEIDERLRRLGAFFRLLDAGIGAFIRGEPFPAEKLQNVALLGAERGRRGG